jgi:selenoprotein W-related protein
MLVEAHGGKIKDVTLIPSKGGCFELKVDGKLVYSKLQTGQFPDFEAVTEQVGKLVPA